MAPVAGARAGERHALARCARLVQPSTRSRGRNGQSPGTLDEPFDVGRIRRRPVEARRGCPRAAGEIRHAVGDDRQPGIGETRRVAVGIEDDAGALRRKPRQHALEDGRAADPDAAPCRRRPCAAPARRRARGRGRAASLSRHAPPPCAGAWRFLPRHRRGPGRTRCDPRPASATKRLPRARPISVRLALRASSTPQAVKPEREIRIGMPMRTVLITISEVSRPVV